MKKVLIFLLFIFVFIPSNSFAQDLDGLSAGIAVSITVNDTNVKDGSVISITPNGYKLTRQAYDPALFGVVSDSPALSIQNINPSAQTKQVISQGNAYVLVSTINGAIKKNDYLSSSKIAGVAQKASIDGFVLGIAMADYNNSNINSVGKILANINPHYNATFIGIKTDLIQNIKTAAGAPFLSPLTTLRYLLAGVIALSGFLLGFIYFGRVVKTGVEALGRNPLAEKAILLSIIFNLLTTLIIMILGFGISYLILIL